MVEQNPSDENKATGQKVQIPDPNDNTSAQAKGEGASAAEATEDQSEEEEKKEITRTIDQSKANVPLQNDIDDLLELLDRNKKKLNLNPNEVTLLQNGIKKGNFASAAKIVKASLRKRHCYNEESLLDDMVPLFEPHNFWDNQPVPKPAEQISLEDDMYDKPIEVKTVDQVQQEPYALAGDYRWSDLDMEDPAVVDEVYTLLLQNYVEDDDAMFRFDYSREFLKWALMPPGYKKNWLIGVRAGPKNKLFGCITGIPVNMNLNGQMVTCAEINFLCVHKKLRAKRLAPILIREITRRVNLCDIW